MKHLKHLFTALLLLCSTVVAAHDFEAGGIYYNILSSTDKTVGVTSGTNEYTGSVVIPESVTYNRSTYSVTSIGEDAFYACTGLTSITIPNSVTSIGNYAFYYCYGLTSITIPNSVTSIGSAAFDSCYGLTSITIPNSVTSIGSAAFNTTAWYNNQPYGVVYAGKVLYKYKGTMPSNTSITIKDGTLSITGSAFSGCTGLTSIIIPNSITSIGHSAFYNCTGLTSITIPNSVTSIGNGAFYDCSGLTSITIPNSVTSIGGGAFSGCTGLTSIEIPNSVTSIGDNAFRDCTGLTSITIPNSVTSIERLAFYGCTGLGTVVNLSNLTFSKGSKNYGYVAYYADRVINSADISGISLDREAVTVEKDESFTLRAELQIPYDLYEDEYLLSEACLFNWSTSNSSVATVKDGVVTAVAAGRATITALAGVYSATCVVTVEESNTIVSLEQLKNNALYYIFQPYHTNGATSWAVDKGGEALKSNVDLGVGLSSSDIRQQFAILSIDGGATHYLYHAGEKKFINKDGSLGEKPVDAVNIEAGAFDNTFMFYFDDAHYINVDGYSEIIINGWRTRDGGNSCAIVLVGEFDPTEALLEQLKNNALYYISQPHHTKGATSWAVDKGGEALKSNVDLGVERLSSDTRQQFAILSIDGGATRYLYHAGEKKFINKDGSLGEKPVDAVNIKSGAFDNTFIFYFDDAHYINVGGIRQMTIDYWNIPDGGNSCTIESVGEFDPEVALGIITGIEDVEDVDGEIVVYNLQGNRILDVDNLNRGIYIVNGKKVFVK